MGRVREYALLPSSARRDEWSGEMWHREVLSLVLSLLRVLQYCRKIEGRYRAALAASGLGLRHPGNMTYRFAEGEILVWKEEDFATGEGDACALWMN